MNCIVNGKSINYQVTGEGSERLLLLHGWGDTQSTFKVLRNEMSKQYTVISLDLPGFGSSDIPEKAWTLDDYTNFLVEFLKKIGEMNIFALIGHSNGGALAIFAIANGQLKPKKLILLASSGIRNMHGFRKKTLLVATKFGVATTFLLPSSVKRRLRKRLYKTVNSDYLVATQMKETFKKVVAQDVQSYAEQINLPTLLLYGSSDSATPVKFGRIFNKLIVGSKLRVINDAGHFLHQSNSSEVNTEIVDFLGGKL